MAQPQTSTGETTNARWGWRLGWLVLIWAVSVLTLGVTAYAFRLLMTWVGLTR